MERAQKRHIEEHYEIADANFEISDLNRALLNWQESKCIMVSDGTKHWDLSRRSNFLNAVSKNQGKKRCMTIVWRGTATCVSLSVSAIVWV